MLPSHSYGKEQRAEGRDAEGRQGASCDRKDTVQGGCGGRGFEATGQRSNFVGIAESGEVALRWSRRRSNGERGNSGSAIFAGPLESVEPAGPEGVQFGGAASWPTYFTVTDMQSHETPLIPSRRTILSPFTKEFRGGVRQ